MKRNPLWSGLLAVLFALMLAAGFSTPALAEEDPAGVNRSDRDHSEEWAYQAPAATVTIDTTQMTPESADSRKLGSDIYYMEAFPAGNGSNAPALVWAPNGSDDLGSVSVGASEAVGQSIVATLTWEGIATLQDGSTADVTLIFSRLTFLEPLHETSETYIDPETGEEKTRVTSVDPCDAHGPICFFKTGGWIGPMLVDGADTSIAMEVDIQVKVTQNGEPVDGTVLFATRDLDVVDPARRVNARYLDYHFDEGFFVNSGSLSQIYVPSDNFNRFEGTGSSDSGNGVGVYATKADNTTYMTGFVMLADAANLKLVWQGQGNGMGTQIFTRGIAHWIKSSSDEGGSIDFQGHLDVPDGSDQSYTLTPDEGYKLQSITITDFRPDGEEIETEIDPEDSSTWPDNIEVTTDTDGNYVVTFKDNNANHKIHVKWEPKTYTVTYLDGDHGSSDGAGNQEAAPYGQNHDPGSGNTVTPDEGYRFTGTYTYQIFDDDGELIEEGETDDPSSIEVLGNIELAPVYERVYKVTYLDGDHGKSDGGDQTDEPYGSPVTGGNKVTPDKNYRFTGKYSYTITHDDGTTETGETDDPTSLEITGDIEFTPIYQKTYTVTYVDPATGRVIQETITLDEGEPEPAAPADPTRPGYKFAGWKRIVDADGNIVYEAQWEAVRVPSRTPRTSDPTSFVPMIASALGGLASIGAGAALRRRKR